MSEYMVEPILVLMGCSLVRKGEGHLTGYLTNYFYFRMALGMVDPLCIDDIWDLDSVEYNTRLCQIISQRKFWGYSGTASRMWRGYSHGVTNNGLPPRSWGPLCQVLKLLSHTRGRDPRACPSPANPMRRG